MERCFHSCARCCLTSFPSHYSFPLFSPPSCPPLSSFLLTLCPTITIPSCLHTNAHRHRSQKHWILIAASPAVSGVTDWLWVSSRECHRTRWLRHSAAMRDALARRRFFSTSWALAVAQAAETARSLALGGKKEGSMGVGWGQHGDGMGAGGVQETPKRDGGRARERYGNMVRLRWLKSI